MKYLFSSGVTFVFHLITWIDKKFKVEFYYNKRYHEKGLINGIEGTIKNKFFWDVTSGIVHMKGATLFAKYACWFGYW